MVAERYHGSRLRAQSHAIWWPLRENVRAFMHRFRPSKDRVPVEVERLLGEMDGLIERGEWDEALARARAAADIVERDGSPRPKRVVGNMLLPLGDCGRGLRLLAEPLPTCRAPDWQGEDLSDRRLFVRQLHTSNMGAPIRMGRFVAGALERAAQCVVIVEPRLVPLFRRTFPLAEVRPTGLQALRDARDTDYVTSFEGLGGRMVTDWPSVEQMFVPLKADAAVAENLRNKYVASASGPLVGISWGSTNARKGTPELAAWAQFIASFPATFISLQYGAVGNALNLLRQDHAEKLVYDETVDQLTDMDRFAAQIGALDAAVTVSNTGAHLAAALGKTTFILVDNLVGRGYPAHGERSWWYPDATLLRKGEREWSVALDQAAERLHAALAMRRTGT